MPLDGAKLICLEEDGGHGETIPAQGRTFKFGYYMNCDVVLEHPNAMGIQCVIDCDAFGRVTIENRCPELPITLNGKNLKKLRPLLHNTEICILEKKFLWHYQSRSQSLAGLQSEDVADFSTPGKQIKKAQQPPNSEPGRRWRRQLQKRLTIHSFTYCIKSDQCLQAVEGTTDENKAPNRNKRKTASLVAEQMSVKKPPPTSPIAIDLIDLKTPKIRKRSLTGQRTPLSCCRLSETVITSYSPRQTGLRPQKSFAVVQSPAATPTKPQTLSEVSLGSFQQMLSPSLHNYRPSMHLIDLTTPTKRLITASPSRNLLKSALKKNHQKEKQTLQHGNTPANTSTASIGSSVCSVHTTDDESVIELSDDVSCSPSPILKTPVRVNTSKSLMKHAIISSAKKVAISSHLQQPAPPQTPFTPKNQQTSNGVRFRSQSTPQRKSLGSFQSPGDNVRASISMTGKSMVTSTPFRADESTSSGINTSERTSILHSPYTSLTSAKNKSRNSLMLKQALTRSPRTSSVQKRKSVSFLETKQTPSKSQLKARKSVSFLDRIENEQSEQSKTSHHTFSIEEDQASVKENVEITATPRKDLTFTPEKEKDLDKSDKVNKTDPQTVFQVETLSSEKSAQKSLVVSMKSSTTKSPAKPDKLFNPNTPETPTTRKNIKRQSIFKPLPGVNSSSKEVKTYVSLTKDKSVAEQLTHTLETTILQNEDELLKESVEEPQTTALRTLSELNKTTPLNKEKPNVNESIISQTPQSSKRRSKVTKASTSVSKIKPNTNIMEYDDFEGLDTIFKTPQARNLMILGSPKSISLQKPTTDSVALMHSTEFDLSANLDEIFKTPQSEFMTQSTVLPAEVEKTLSPEEAFDMLVGRPINTKTYGRKTPIKGGELSPLKGPKRSSLPKTDIEEWIDKVNESVEIVEEQLGKHLDVEPIAEAVEIQDGLDQEEDEMSYFTSTTQGELSRDPLTMSSVSGSLNSTTRRRRMRSPTDESAMTIQEYDEEENIDASVLKDPLDVSAPFVKKISLSPNISGIDILDHTSESVFSETLEVSDESEKEEVTTIGDLDQTKTCVEESMLDVQISPDKARIDMEKAFENFEKERKLVDAERLVSTPQPIKSVPKGNTRRTMGNQRTLDSYFDVKALKKQREIELDFENFVERPSKVLGERLVKTPQHEKPITRDMRKTMGGQAESSFDLNLAKAEREMELAFKNFEENPTICKLRVAQTPDSKKVDRKDHRRTMGTSLVPTSEFDLQAAKAEREVELAFENFEEVPSIQEKRLVQTPDAKKISRKDHRRTMGTSLVPTSEFDLHAAKAEREVELAFENFEEVPSIQEKRLVQTPDARKISRKDHRRTMGTSLVPTSEFDLQAAKAEREVELAFENFEEVPSIQEKRLVQTPDATKISRKDHRRTMGTSLVPTSEFDLHAAMAEREVELAFENFEEVPSIQEKRLVQTPDAKKISRKDHRRTMGTSLVPTSEFDLHAAKAEREVELAFENFEEVPSIQEKRLVQTPDARKISRKDHRRTMGTSLVPTSEFDLQAAKAEREVELAFENFEEVPSIQEKRLVQTPDATKISRKDHRRTMGTSLVPTSEFDLHAAMAEREVELAFENFEEVPSIQEKRLVQTPDAKKISRKDHRRTMGTSLVPTSEFDLHAAKAEREVELAFENFEEVPSIQEKRLVQTPDAKKISRKDHRRTMGTSLVPTSEFDLHAAKAEREVELAFENFEEVPSIQEKRLIQTPDAKKISRKDHRRTMGTSLVPTSEFDLQVAKDEREMELAFENFEEEPSIQEKRVVQTPDAKKIAHKDHRRTMGTNFVSASKLDLKAEKAAREMELAFENFEEEPSIPEKRVVQTPDAKKISRKDHRRTMGTSLVTTSEFDLQVAKDEREMELAFENFEEEPSIQEKRVVQTPDAKKIAHKDHRRTMGTNLVSAAKLDLKAEKAAREMELAFENFEEEPSIPEKLVVQTPDAKKISRKDHRRTMGTSLVPTSEFDLHAAKAEREVELAFENFEEVPSIQEKRLVQTPDAKKISRKDHRRTMGTSLVPTSEFDLQVAKDEREMELAFENFEEEPSIQEKRVVQTPDAKKIAHKDHRRTMGTNLVSAAKLDLKAEKAAREMELAFENFEEEPSIPEKRVVQTPDAKKISRKDHRRTMGTSLVPTSEFDLHAAKAEREVELAFENFEEVPSIQEKRLVQTPDAKKISRKDHRRTMGTSLVPTSEFDLQVAKDGREMELAFENFEEEPSIQEKRVVQTPDAKKIAHKDHRRTMGTNLVSAAKLDLKAEKAAREMELAFENFEEEPSIPEKRVVQTPDAKKISRKDHRRTMGTSLVPTSEFDLHAAKAEREVELAFENFEEVPSIQEKRLVQTPDAKKISRKDHRRTMGTSLVPTSEFDLQVAKDEREMELAFENFEEEPSIQEKRVVQTPDAKKIAHKDHRRTMGTSLIPTSEFDLQAAKAEREVELAFENFEEVPSIQEKRLVQTPDATKISRKDHRRTMGTSLVPTSEFDLQAAKAEREVELAFENFEEVPSIQEKRLVQTPEAKKIARKDHRRTMGTNLVSASKLDLKAEKAAREMELAFENFEEEPSIQEKRVVQTPDAKKITRKDRRRTMGTSLVPEGKLDIKAARAELEMEIAFKDFKLDHTDKVERLANTPDVKKRDKATRMSLGYKKTIDQSFDPFALKTEREKQQKRKAAISKKVAIVKPLPKEKGGESESEHELVTENEEENQPVDGNVELQICNKVVFKPNPPNKQLTPSSVSPTNLRPRRKRMHSVDQSLVQKCDEGGHGKISFEEPVSSINSLSRSRRRRQKTIDDVDQLKSQEDEFTTNVLKDLTTSDKELSKAKKRDQTQKDNHLDSIEDELIAVVDFEKNQHESDHHTVSTGQIASCRSQRKRHVVLTTEDETTQADTPEVDFRDKKTSSSQIRHTDVDRAVDETKYIPSTRKKRLKKVSSSNVPPAQSEEPTHLALEPIVEDEKKPAHPVLEESCDVDGQIKSKPLNSRANQNDASKQDEVSNDGVTNSTPDVGAEVDEIISATPAHSRKRLRGRIAQLNVVVVESNDTRSSLTDDKDEPDTHKENQLNVSRTFTVKIKPRECENKTVFAEENNGMMTTRTDAKDEIPSTPLPTKTRGRRPVRKLASAEPNVVPALRRTRRGSVQQDIDVEVVKVENQDEEIVISTPVLSRTRGRKAALKVEPTTTTFTKLSPSQEVSHGRAIEEVDEVSPAAAIDEVLTAKEKDEISHQEANPALVIDEIQSVKTNVESVSEETEGEIVPAPQKVRGRKPGTKSKITESVENRFPGIVQSVEVPLKTREHRAAMRLEHEEIVIASSTSDREEVALKVDLKTSIAEENDVQRQALANKRQRLTNDKLQSKTEEKNSSKTSQGQNHEEPAENHTETSELEKVIPTKTRNGAAITKLEPTNLLPENSTKQSRRRRLRQEFVVAIESNEMNADEETSSKEAGIHTAESDVESVVPSKRRKDEELSQAEATDISLEKATRRNGRRPRQLEVVVKTENQYIEANNEEKPSQPEVETITEKSHIEKEFLSKKPRDGTEPEPEVKEISKRGLRRAGRHNNEVVANPQSTEESELENVIPPKKRKWVIALKSEPVEFSVEEQLEKYDIERKIETVQSHNPESTAAIKSESANTISTPVRKRGRPAIVKKEILQVESMSDIQTKTPYIEIAPLSVPKPSRGRGRPAKVKLEPTAANETPNHKGKSDMSHGDDEASTDTTPTKNEPEIKSTGRSLRGRKVLEKVNSSAKTSKKILQSAEIVTEETVTKKPSRGRRVLSTSTPQVNIKIEPTETESQKKAVRGRRVVMKNDTTLESTSHTEEERHTTPIKTKVARGRKLVTKDDTSEKENVKIEENKTTVRGRRGNNRRVPSENEEIDKKSSAPEEPETKTTPEKENVKIEVNKTTGRGRRGNNRKVDASDARVPSENEIDKKSSAPEEPETKTTPEKENVKIEENKTTGRGRRGNNRKVDASDARVPSENDEIDIKSSASEEPEKKTTQSRRGVQIKPEPQEDNSQAAYEENQPSPALKKATRGRKPAALKSAKDSDDEQSSSESQKKPTRSRKVVEPAKEEEKAIPKRTKRRNLEVASEHNQDTPSKRIRRKPNILLGDEFVQ